MGRGWIGTLLTLACLPAVSGEIFLALLERPLTALGAAEISALVSGSVAFAATCALIVHHALHLQWPELQACFVRILLFAPAVVVVCVLTLLWPDQEDCFELITSFWEAIIFFAFLQCLFIYCGGRRAVAKYLETSEGGLRWPLCCCFPRRCPRTSFRNGGHAVASYEWRVALFCLLKPTCDVARIILHNLHVVSIVVNILNGISSVATIIAMTSIMMLERRVLHVELQGLRASAKFWAIKGLVGLIIIEQRIVIGFADNTSSKAAAMDPSQAYAMWEKAHAIHRSLQILILWEMFALGLPLLIIAYSVPCNAGLLTKAPSGAVDQSDGAVLFLCRAAFLAPLDCASFVWHSLFRCEEPAYTRWQDPPLQLNGPMFSESECGLQCQGTVGEDMAGEYFGTECPIDTVQEAPPLRAQQDTSDGKGRRRSLLEDPESRIDVDKGVAVGVGDEPRPCSVLNATHRTAPPDP